jgi:hypothetical protein
MPHGLNHIMQPVAFAEAQVKSTTMYAVQITYAKNCFSEKVAPATAATATAWHACRQMEPQQQQTK